MPRWTPGAMVFRTKRGLEAVWEYVVVDPVTDTVDYVVDVADLPSGADVKDVAVDVFDGLVSGAITVAEAIAGVFQDIGSGIANATLDVLKWGGGALVDGVENTYDYIRLKLRGKEPDVIAAVTVGMLTLLMGAYLWNAAKRGTMTYSE